jgi:hypothetical protein
MSNESIGQQEDACLLCFGHYCFAYSNTDRNCPRQKHLHAGNTLSYLPNTQHLLTASHTLLLTVSPP